MATYIKNLKKSLEATYNADPTDNKLDFNLEELSKEVKVDTSVDVVLPSLSGIPEDTIPILSGVEGFTVEKNASAPDWLDGVTAYDEQQGNLTADITVDDSDVDLTTIGTYDLVYAVEDADGNEQTETTNVIVWEEVTITFEKNGGTGVSSMDVMYHPDTTYTINPPADPTLANYEFDDWYSDVGLTTPYDFDTVISEDITVYAGYTPVDYTITYNLDGGENNVLNSATFTVEDLNVTLEAPTKDAHTFVAWHDSAALDSIVTELTVAEDTELWAEFVLAE